MTNHRNHQGLTVFHEHGYVEISVQRCKISNFTCKKHRLNELLIILLRYCIIYIIGGGSKKRIFYDCLESPKEPNPILLSDMIKT